MPVQKCPACGAAHDVGIFVSGQRVRCSACGLPFVVQRNDSVLLDPAAQAAADADSQAAQPKAGGERRAAQAIPKAPLSGPDTQQGAGSVDIPGFEMFEVIGKGGMGRVFRARQLSLDRVVAIKVLNDDLARHKSFIRRFEKETASLAAMSHPNITQIFDRGNVGPTYFFVMEFVGGSSLRQRLNRGRMPLDEALGMFTTLCRAIDHAHRRGVIHRDLKPENVLFTEDGVLKVADFGLANILDRNGRWELTRTKVSMGTVNYMAPEQRRDAKHVDGRADIYSLGVMLYEMLVGELPLGRFDPPSRHRSELPAELDRLVLKMLDFDPDERPQQAALAAATMEAVCGRGPAPAPVAAAIQPAEDVPTAAAESPAVAEPAAGEPVPLPPAPAPQVAERPAGRARWRLPGWAWLALAGGLVAAGALGILALLLQSDLRDRPGDLVVRSGVGGLEWTVVHPHQVKYLSPAVHEQRGERTSVTYDFLPSSLQALPVRFVGGDWETGRGSLIQDTCRGALTLNQVPAKAVFGRDPVPPEGLELEVAVGLEGATWDDGTGPKPQEDQLRQVSSGLGALLPSTIEQGVALGFVDPNGQGLMVLLPAGAGRSARILRAGEGMEGAVTEHEIAALELGRAKPMGLRLQLREGRVHLAVEDREVLDELAGFRLGFRGHPVIGCQNLKCAFRRVRFEVSAAR